jgi:hypothetical protein
MPSFSPAGSEFWITIAIIVVVVLRFLARELRERRIRTSMLFTVPIILGAASLYLCYLTLQRAPNLSLELLAEAVAALVIGVAIGLAVAHFTRVKSAGPGLILVRGSWITVAIWLASFALRLVGRFLFSSSNFGSQLLLNSGLLLMLAFATLALRVRILQERRALPD